MLGETMRSLLPEMEEMKLQLGGKYVVAVRSMIFPTDSFLYTETMGEVNPGFSAGGIDTQFYADLAGKRLKRVG